MARPGVTYTEVAEAASQLKGQGKNPTIEQIRLILGTGSSTTIANHLREWKEAQSGTSLIASREKIPEELVALVKGLWERVIGQSEEKVKEIAYQHENSLKELQADLDKYRRNNQRWQNMFQQWNNEKKNLTDLQTNLEKQLQDLNYDYISLRGQYELVAQQLKEKQERIEELHHLHQQLQTNHERDRQHAKEQREEERNNCLRQTNALRDELKKLNSEADMLEESNSELQKKINLYQQKNEIQASQLEQFEQKLTAVEAERKEQVRFNSDWQQKYTELNTQLETRNRQFFETQAEANMLAQQYEKTLLSNQTLQQEKLALAQEKASLEGQLKQLAKNRV